MKITKAFVYTLDLRVNAGRVATRLYLYLFCICFVKTDTEQI